MCEKTNCEFLATGNALLAQIEIAALRFLKKADA